jgi:hypothetical protein
MALPVTQETLIVNSSPRERCWRMVYTDTEVLQIFESGGVTQTVNHLFCSSCTDPAAADSVPSQAGRQECLSKAESMKLTIPESLVTE